MCGGGQRRDGDGCPAWLEAPGTTVWSLTSGAARPGKPEGLEGCEQRGPEAAVDMDQKGGTSASRETDGQASGGNDSGDWIFTIREKDPKNLENGALQPSDLERHKV